ncbi:hypothetical protein JCM11251_002848 [Rhodosporidiobolus azoricus]
MSLLSDHDFLLHALQLSYLRHVLPSHAPASASAGHSPYNLLSFPPLTLTNPDSPYLALSPHLRDEASFPELRSGRGSPPLALQLARGGTDEAEGTTGAGRRRRGGPGPLNYTKTIGKGGESAGAAASLGRGKGRRGKLTGVEKETSPQRDGRTGHEDGQDTLVEGLGPQNPQDAFLTAQRASQPSLVPPASGDISSQSHFPDARHPLPPELVIHSPERTPAHSPPLSPVVSIGNQTFQPFPQAAGGAAAGRRAGAAEPSGEDVTGSPSSPVPGVLDSPTRTTTAKQQRFTDEPPSVAPSSPASPSDFPSRPPIAGSSPTSLSSTSSTSPYPSPSPAATPSVGGQDTESDISSFAPHANAAAASMASSGVSLFGTSRLTGPRLGPIGEGEDSEASDFLAAPPPRQVEPPSPSPPVEAELKEEEPQEQQQPVVPSFQLPPGLRVRERRRVNLRPGIGLVIPPSLGGPPPPQPAEPAAAPLEESAPAQAPPPGPAPVPSSPTPAPAPATAGGSLVPPSAQTSSRPSSPQPILFPPRSVYIRQPGPSSSTPLAPSPGPPKRSALSALLTPAPSSAVGEAGSVTMTTENPFARLYSSLISRTAAPPPPPAPLNRRRRGPTPAPAPDAPLQLTLWFPHLTGAGAKTNVKVLLKNPRTLSGGITVEEVIGAGLYAYLEEGKKPSLTEGMIEAERLEWAKRAREGEETARWSLRIVEEGEDGEVDEDFPPLDRTRNISAFAFTEFAIAKAEGEQQVADNLAKQSTLTRRPSRILSNPVPSLPPTASALFAVIGGSANSTAAQPDAAKQEVKLRVQVPLSLAGEDKAGPIEISVNLSMTLSEVLDRTLVALTPAPSLFPHRQPSPSSPFPLNSSDYALLLRLSDADLVLPLDKTVSSANLLSLTSEGGAGTAKKAGAVGAKELWVVPKSVLGGVGLGLGPRMSAAMNKKRIVSGGTREGEAQEGEGVDAFAPPSPHLASSSPQVDAEQQQQLLQQQALAAAGPPYLHYNVLRKLPMSLGGRHPRTIAIDGDYLHFMPPDPRFFGAHAAHNAPLPAAHDASTSGRTTSLHISSVHSCKVSRRSASSFKIVVHTPRNIDKRYDFEAQTPEEAREIVERIRETMRMYGAERGRSGQGGRLVKGGGRG